MKIWAYIILAGILIGAATATYKAIDKAGYNRAIVETQQANIKAQNAAIEKRMAEWIATQDQAEVVIQIKEKIVEKIRVVTKEVPKIIETFVIAECRDLGAEYAGLLNDQVRASNNARDESPTAAPSMDASLP